jgi:hypothetical protein
MVEKSGGGTSRIDGISGYGGYRNYTFLSELVKLKWWRFLVVGHPESMEFQVVVEMKQRVMIQD